MTGRIRYRRQHEPWEPVRFVTVDGEAVAIYRDERTRDGFLPEDAWKQLRLERERREQRS